MAWVGSSLRLSGAAELHRTQPQGASFPCFFFPFFLFFFPSFLPSSLFFVFSLGLGSALLGSAAFFAFFCFLCFQFPAFAFSFLLLLSVSAFFAFSFRFLFALCFLLQPLVPLYILLFSAFPPFLLSMARCLHWQPWRLAVGIGCGLWCASPCGRAKGRA